jgi:hypothetical protein
VVLWTIVLFGVAAVAGITLLATLAWWFTVSPKLSPAERTRRVWPVRLIAGLCVALALGVLLIVVLGPGYARNARAPTARAAVLNAKPLVEALISFRADQGVPPASLDELVPRYLPSVPETGWPEHPRFSYLRTQHGFRLWIALSSFLEQDQLLYAPIALPGENLAGPTERYDEWIFIDE